MSISAKERREIPDNKMGDPAHDKFPLDTEEHIRSAANLIGHAKDKEQVAKNILRRAKEEGVSTDSMHKVKQVAGVEEQVPPMSDGTSLGNTPPRLMAPYYDEAGEELAQRLATASSQASSCCSVSPTTEDAIISRLDRMMARSDSKRDPIVFAQKIVKEISTQVEKDSKPPTGNQNCQLCTWCAEARYRGINALPRPIYSPRDPALNIKGETIVLNPVKESFKSQRDVIERVRTAVDSRWYVHVNWKDSTGGHEFLVVNLDDYAYILDAQAGKLKEIDETDSTDSYFRDINFKNSYMVRLDTKQFNTTLFNDVNNPDNVMPWKNSLDIPYMRDNGMLAPGDDSDPRFRRVLVPSEEGLKYLKEDPETRQYWEDMHKATNGEFLVNRETGEAIGHVFVHTNKKDKGFIFNLEVTPSYRRQGYGWILIDDAVRRFGGEDLTVRCDNEAAVQLYLQYGFEIYKKGVWFDPPHEEYWMKLKKELIPKPVQEAACAAYSASIHNAMSQLRNLIGSRYDITGGGMGVNRYIVKSKLNPKLAFQVDLNGANLEVMPVISDIPKYEKKRRGIAFMRAADAIARYIDEIEAEQTATVQEGAFQDLKNGVNPFSDDMVFHVTADKHADGQVWKPRVPDYLDPYNPEETGFEDNTTPRICFSTSIEGCLNGITVNLPRQNPDQFDKMYVYVPEKPWKQYKHKTNKELVKEKLVYDANVSREVWIMEPVRMKLYGVIRVDQVSNVKRKSVVPTSKGVKGDRNYFTYKWHWIVKPKVLEKGTKFDYSPERVIDDLCIDLKKFKYGLIRDGKVITNASDADYEKYWKFHSGQEVDEAGGGQCWDMVEYEAGYLEAFGVAYKKYFLSFTTTKNQPLRTHTICVVPLNGKYVYIEQAFKRVIDEWGSDRQKTFDKLNDIFDYVAECDAECEGQAINFGVWDYTNTKIDYGVSSKEFMQAVMSGKMIYDGEAGQPKSVKESFEIPARFSAYHYREGYYV